MKTRIPLGALLLAGVLPLAGPARAVVCETDPRPAATLLLPYFEVDRTAANTFNTGFDVTNVSRLPTLTKVEIWSDLGVALFGFNLYLGAFDTQRVDLRQLLVQGVPPATQPGIFASCIGALPPPAIPGSLLADYQNALLGKPVGYLLNHCAGIDHGDNLLRGYVTIDTVSNCTLRYQGDPGYWASGGGGDATNQNRLVGSYFYTSPTQHIDQGEPLVHLEASAASVETSTVGQYTFYGKFDSWTAADNREPLPTTFAARFVNQPRAGITTDLVVWRDAKIQTLPFTCPALLGVRPASYNLAQEAAVAFDEAGTASALPAKLFPAVAQRVRVGSAQLPVVPSSGWLFLNLNHSLAAAGANPPEDSRAAQAWVTVLTRSSDRGTGAQASHYDSACTARHGAP
jgi:hypothetical protein